MSIPDILISDNDPQFSCAEFNKFADSWGFEHRTSSPGHPQSNGLAEKTVGTAKKLMQKALNTKTDVYLALLEYRNTPLQCGYTPSQLALGRRTKSIVPITNKALQPTAINDKQLRTRMQKSKAQQKSNFDKTSRTLAPLSVNDSVRIKFGKIWKIGRVMKIHSDRSYIVQTADGGTYRRPLNVITRTPTKQWFGRKDSRDS